ncbi:hypothetical protein ABZ234_03525 [Nocardiopsis sp. NPDC006198]|uniref:hypothetical protein n=1 Tax=Nocardiopsis sp. NPDC006198 TaxID=3154472 RepID=UPI0033B31F49
MKVRQHFDSTVHETQPNRDDWTECHRILTLDGGDLSATFLPDDTPVDCGYCLREIRLRERLRKLRAQQ